MASMLPMIRVAFTLQITATLVMALPRNWQTEQKALSQHMTGLNTQMETAVCDMTSTLHKGGRPKKKNAKRGGLPRKVIKGLQMLFSGVLQKVGVCSILPFLTSFPLPIIYPQPAFNAFSVSTS